MAYTVVALKDKILEMYPDIKKNGISLSVSFSKEKNAYILKLKKKDQELITYLDKKDADDCMNNVKCVYLGVQVGQFIKNFQERPKTERKKVSVGVTLTKYKEIKINIDDEGYLKNFDDWNEEVAQTLAEREGLGSLSKEQLDILRFIRNYYKTYNFFPLLNAICKNVGQPKKCVTEKFIDPLVAWKLAGLPKPDETTVNIVKYGVTPT